MITRTYDGLNRVTSYEDAKLKKDFVGFIIGLVSPFADEIGYLAEIYNYIWEYKDGVKEEYE